MPTQKDPTTFGYQNFYSTTLTGDITSGTLTIGLATVPSPTSGILIIEPDSTSAREVVLYTSKGASTVTCPADGRGWSGTSASAHLTGSTVIMASVDEYFEGLADGTLSTDPLRSTLFRDYVVSGGAVAQSAGLVGTFSNIVFYLNGQRYSGTSIANKTYTASKDTYVDITAISGGAVTVAYTEVANGAAAPALSANYLRIAKVVTSGAAITSVLQTGWDSLGNPYRNTVPNPTSIGTASRTTTMSGFSAENTMTSVVVLVPATSREIAVKIAVPQVYSSIDGDRFTIKLKEDGTVIQQYYARAPLTHGWSGSVDVQKAAPSAGSHTYSATIERDAGTGTLTCYAAATSPMQITVDLK